MELSRSGIHQRTGLIVALAIVASASAAKADSVTVKGTTLHGAVAAVHGAGIDFETEYGKGYVVITYEDLEDIQTDAPYHLYHGDEMTVGRIVGFADGKLLVGDDPATATPVDPATLHQAYSDAVYNAPYVGFFRRTFALWRGSFDLGFSLTRSTADTTGLAIGFLADRLKRPSRVTARVSYRYGTQKDKDDDESSTTENELRGGLRGEYDIFDKWYVFASGDGEYDEIERLSFRGVPKAGVGYRFWENDWGLFQVEAGGAYAYEKYFGGDSNDYFAIAFGKLLEVNLPYDSLFRWQTDYLPAVDDWVGDYLVRTEAALIAPITAYLSLKFAVSDQYDSTPADDAEKNSLAMTAGISIIY